MNQTRTQNTPVSVMFLVSLAMPFFAISCTKPKSDVVTDATAAATKGTQGERRIPKGFVEIPAGSFMQGSYPDSRSLDLHARPPGDQVTLSRSFLLKATPVTQGEWRAVMGNNPSVFSSCGDQCPVERVNWYEAVTYLNRLSEREGLEACYTLSGCSGTLGGGCASSMGHCTGDYTCSSVSFKGLGCQGYRLPTEAEWEYAARAGTTGTTYGGLSQIAWYRDNSGEKTHPVGQKQANAWGLYDMLGNVSEWTGDWFGYYGETPRYSPPSYRSGAVTDPVGPDAGVSRVYRGCSWATSTRFCRAGHRSTISPATRVSDVGFRPAMSSGHVVDEQIFTLAMCTGGRTRASDGVNCCWAGQEWSRVRNRCVGVPTTCSAGQRVVGESCVIQIPKGFVKIPAGSFMQGDVRDTYDGGPRWTKQRQVTLSRSFLLKATPVTQGEWRAVIGNNPSYFSSCGDQCPVERVSWYDAVTYLNRLSEREGLEACYTLSCMGTLGGGCAVPTPAEQASGPEGLLSAEQADEYKQHCTGDYSCDTADSGFSCTGYRLPTEAEWEYAARAGTTGATYGALSQIAWYEGNSGGKTHPVGQKQANAWGLYDMLGNVSEWTGDWWSEYPRLAGAVTDPVGPVWGGSSTPTRTIRGCYWNSTNCRAAARYWGQRVSYRSYTVGFRPARSIP